MRKPKKIKAKKEIIRNVSRVDERGRVYFSNPINNIRQYITKLFKNI